MLLNARHFGAKRKAKCCYLRDDKHKHSLQWYKHNLLEPLKKWLKRAKQPLKSGNLGVKSRYLGLKKHELATKIERQSGAKCRCCSKKWRKRKDVKVKKATIFLLKKRFFR